MLRGFVAVDDDATGSRACQYGNRTILGDGLQGAIEILRQVERLDLGFIGKDDVDIVADKFEETVAMTLDAEGVGQA